MRRVETSFISFLLLVLVVVHVAAETVGILLAGKVRVTSTWLPCNFSLLAKRKLPLIIRTILTELKVISRRIYLGDGFGGALTFFLITFSSEMDDFEKVVFEMV